MLPFERLINQLQRKGHRRLVVLSGDAPWAQAQAVALRDTLPGDWLWLDENLLRGKSRRCWRWCDGCGRLHRYRCHGLVAEFLLKICHLAAKVVHIAT